MGNLSSVIFLQELKRWVLSDGYEPTFSKFGEMVDSIQPNSLITV